MKQVAYMDIAKYPVPFFAIFLHDMNDVPRG